MSKHDDGSNNGVEAAGYAAAGAGVAATVGGMGLAVGGTVGQGLIVPGG
ncbi:MAG: hypothetical protein KME60_05935 [Cyanomargarita calcarea GSE-NOS-MK-12-04C]|jgi:hypothetical protein|uniref:Uncharacterized protein n=1 Tax=Cyanomargarita calcarea GSE-NOS-MK-12-04C TaxID=2839659 RepID=A0A951QL60_9CYAN|nr:hypothetical protein [Cyanomargarita calcarea GSE-NOS-MK-12-04C]